MKWKNKTGISPEKIVSQINKVRKISGASVTYSGFFSLKIWQSIFFTNIIIDTSKYSQEFYRHVLHKTLNSTTLPAPFTVKQFGDQFVKNLNDEARKQKKFTVVVPAFGISGLTRKKCNLQNCKILIKPSKSNDFIKNHLNSIDKFLPLYKHPNPDIISLYNKVDHLIISCNAVSHYDAFYQAEDAYNLLFGALNLRLLRADIQRMSGGKTPQILGVTAFPYVTIHDQNKEMFEGYWYFNWEKPSEALFRGGHLDEYITSRFNKVLSHVRKSNWRRDAERAIQQYYVSFSNSNMMDSFRDGWRLLELVGGFSNSNHRTLVKRASFLFPDPEIYAQIGFHLLERRNAISHVGRIGAETEDEQIAIQMHNFVLPITKFFVSNPFGFETKEELWSFLDLPPRAIDRRKQEQLYMFARKYRRD